MGSGLGAGNACGKNRKRLLGKVGDGVWGAFWPAACEGGREEDWKEDPQPVVPYKEGVSAEPLAIPQTKVTCYRRIQTFKEKLNAA